jgi:hypothetical protein
MEEDLAEEAFDAKYATWKLEKIQRLLTIVAMAAVPTGPTVGNPVYWAQFDDANAWYRTLDEVTLCIHVLTGEPLWLSGKVMEKIHVRTALRS